MKEDIIYNKFTHKAYSQDKFLTTMKDLYKRNTSLINVLLGFENPPFDIDTAKLYCNKYHEHMFGTIKDVIEVIEYNK